MIAARLEHEIAPGRNDEPAALLLHDHGARRIGDGLVQLQHGDQTVEGLFRRTLGLGQGGGYLRAAGPQAVLDRVLELLGTQAGAVPVDGEGQGLAEPGLDRVIHAGYKLLGLETYFTAGQKEVRAWTIHIGDTAPQAAGVIHGDFERGFIRAQTIAFEDYIAYRGEQAAKDAGKMRAEGKDYVVKDGDVMNFLFSS